MPIDLDEDSLEITQLVEFEPSRMDGVKSAATGFPILMLKGLDDRPECDVCAGNGKLVKATAEVVCPKCRGTGLMPKVGQTEKELFETAKETAVSESGKPTTPPHNCPT